MARKNTTKTGKEKRYYTKALRCPDGSRKYIRGKTKAELERKVREAQAQLGMGININSNITVVELAQTWIDVYKRPHVRPQSLKGILGILNNHILPVIGSKAVKDVRPADCARVMAVAKDKAHGTQMSIRANLKALFDCAIENSIIARTPVTKGVIASGRPGKEREPLTREQLELLCQTCLDQGLDELYTLVLLCAFAGLRISEALGLHLSSIDFTKGIITVCEQYEETGGTTPLLKTDSSNRMVPAPPILLARLANIRKSKGNGYVFDVAKRKLRTSLSTKLRRLCKVSPDGQPKERIRALRSDRAVTPALDFYVHPHLLRHTYATICFEEGLDIKEVQYLLGHATPDMTMKLYVHYTENQRQEDTAKKIDKAFEGVSHIAIC